MERLIFFKAVEIYILQECIYILVQFRNIYILNVFQTLTIFLIIVLILENSVCVCVYLYKYIYLYIYVYQSIDLSPNIPRKFARI